MYSLLRKRLRANITLCYVNRLSSILDMIRLKFVESICIYILKVVSLYVNKQSKRKITRYKFT